MFSVVFLVISRNISISGKNVRKHKSQAFIVPSLSNSYLMSGHNADAQHGEIGAFQSAMSTPIYSNDKNKCPPNTNPMPAQCIITPLSGQQLQSHQQPQQSLQYYQPQQYAQAYSQPQQNNQQYAAQQPHYTQVVAQPQQPHYTQVVAQPQQPTAPAVQTVTVSPPSRPFRTIKNEDGEQKNVKESQNPPKKPSKNDEPLQPGVVKRTVSTVVQRCDSITPLDTIRGIDPNLATKIEKIFDYQGHTIIPWDVTEDLNTTNQHPMPNWCLLYQKARDAISVFHQVKDIIGSMISDITTYQRRAKEYLREIAGKLSKNVLKMSDDLEKVRRSKDMTMRNYFMKDFTSLECSSHALIVKYKNLKSWVSHVVKGFSGLFLPLYNSSRTRERA